MIKLSIIIVSWETRALLHACLESVFARLPSAPTEVIVVDNASTDGSPEMIAARFKDAVLIRNRHNVGFAVANNQAIETARGEYVLLLNSDTIVLDDVLSQCITYMDAHEDVAALGCRVLNADGSMQVSCSQFPTLPNLLLQTSGLVKLPWLALFDRYRMRRWDRTVERDVDVVAGCFMMVRRKVIDTVGCLDPAFFFYGEETDWCRRMRAEGWRVRFAPVGEIIHHGGASAKKLDYRRDVLLSSAMVRLHLKHGGRIKGIAAWLIVNGFNVSRAALWTLVSLARRDRTTASRRDHFLNVVRYGGNIWPKAPSVR